MLTLYVRLVYQVHTIKLF